MGFLSRLGRFVTHVAARTLGVLADCAEAVVGVAKDMWNVVKPYVTSHLQPLLRVIHDRFATAEWARSAIRGMYYALEWVKNFSESTLAQNLDRAIQWAIDAARRFRDWVLAPQEIAEAEQHRRTLATLPALPPAQQRAAQQVSFMANYLLIKSWLIEAIAKDSLTDLTYYLRLRAIQNLLLAADAKLRDISSIEEVSDDDIFLLEIAARLRAPEAVISEEDTERLDRLLLARFGATLLPFVFNELSAAWNTNVKERAEREAAVNKLLIKAIRLQRVHAVSSQLTGLAPGQPGHLSTTEQQEGTEMAGNLLTAVTALNPVEPVAPADFTTLQAALAATQRHLESFHKRTMDLGMCAGAAEGFLQYLKEPEKFDDRVHLRDSMEEVGRIIVECAEFKKPLSELPAEKLELVHDFSVIFRQDGLDRAGDFVTVPVGP